MIVSSGHVVTIRDIASKDRYADAREACGFILSSGQVIEIPNLANGSAHFLMQPEKQLEYWDDAEIIWHTHPISSSAPSSLDMQMFDLVYAGKAMLIVSIQMNGWTLTSR